MKQTIDIDVPDGWEVEKADRMYDIPDQQAVQWYCVKLRRVHVWPEAVLQFARFHKTPWMGIYSEGHAYLCKGDGGEDIAVPASWAPPHDHSGDGWRNCKWRLPVEDKQ